MFNKHGKQEDLVPFVILLTHAERNGPMEVARNYTNPFIGVANAQLNVKNYVNCVIVALGAGVLWSPGGSSASAWTVVAMQKAFGAVAKRMLGSVGVAISVINFGLYLYQEDHN